MATIKVRINSGEASSAPPLGPTLGQHQINIGAFTKDFNAKSDAIYEKGIPLGVKIYKYSDKTYDMFISGPLLTPIIRNVLGDSDEILIEELYDIALAHSKKLKVDPMRSARTVLGSLATYRPQIKIVDKCMNLELLDLLTKL